MRGTLLAVAGLTSAVVSLMGISIIHWGVDLRHSTARELLEGLLLCPGAVLSAPAFLVYFFSPAWHRRLIWPLAFASVLIPWAAIVITRSSRNLNIGDALSSIPIAFQPPAAVRLARDDISRPSPRLTSVVADSVTLARIILDRVVR
jgi:hypothetical protein